MSFTPAAIFEPNTWTVGNHDLRYVDRAGGKGLANIALTWVSGLAVYAPFTISQGGIVYDWWWVNGTLTTAHNLDFGLYREDFSKIQSLGSTAGGTTATAVQNTSTWTELYLGPGRYYMAFANDSTRAFLGSNDVAGQYQMVGMLEQTGLGSTLPSPAVPVAFTRAFCPHFGFRMKDVAV